MAYNIADLFEHTVTWSPIGSASSTDRIDSPDREMDERGNRIGHYLAAPRANSPTTSGSTPRTHQPAEAMLGCLKIRAVPINVNYRYVEDELSYLIGNAELVRAFSTRSTRTDCPWSPTVHRS